MSIPIDGFDDAPEVEPTQNELSVPISYENFVAQYDARASAFFSQFLREIAEVRAQAQQLLHERDAALAEAAAAKAVLKDFMAQAEADAVRQATGSVQGQ